jgi:hypothetical protein
MYFSFRSRFARFSALVNFRFRFVTFRSVLLFQNSTIYHKQILGSSELKIHLQADDISQPICGGVRTEAAKAIRFVTSIDSMKEATLSEKSRVPLV